MLRSVEEALFEVSSWLLFWPKTFLWALFLPQRIPPYVDAELAKDADHRFGDRMAPIAFLVVTQAVSGVLNPDGLVRLVTLQKVKETLEGSIEALVMLHALIALITPMCISALTARAESRPLDRVSLEPYFLKQCFIYTVHVCIFNVTSAFWTNPWIVYAIPIAWLTWAETRMLRADTQRPLWQAFAIFAAGYIAGVSALVLFLLALNRFTMFE